MTKGCSPSAEDLRLRLARPDDLYAVRSMQSAAVSMVRTETYCPREKAAWQNCPAWNLEELVEAERLYLLTYGKIIAGSAGWEPTGDGVTARLRAVFIDPGFQGNGLGALLVRLVEADIAATGHRRLLAPTTLSSVGFYRKLGYASGQREVHQMPQGVTLPYELMERTIELDHLATLSRQFDIAVRSAP